MQTIEVQKAQDWAVEYRVRAGDGHGKPIRVVLDADHDAGATSLTIKPDHPAFAPGDKLLLGEDTIISVSGTCAAGDTTLDVSATPCALDRGNELTKLVDLSGYSIKMVVLERRGDAAASAFLADSVFTVSIPTQSGADFGKVNISCLAASTASKDPGSYYGALWRRDSGNAHPLDEFTFKLIDSAAAGFA